MIGQNVHLHRVLVASLSIAALPFVSGCFAGDEGGGGGGGGWGYERLAMMSNFTGAYPAFAANAGGGWASNQTSISANLISGASALQDSIVAISDDCYGYRDVSSFPSEEGVSPITLATAVQTGTGVYDGTKYVISGLQFGPAFTSSSDMLTISHDDGAGTMISDSVQVPPPMTSPDDHLGVPAGLDTMFRAPEGEFDIMYVFVNLSGSSAFAGAVCEFEAAEMTLAGDMREHAFVDAATAAWIAAEGLTPVSVYPAYMRRKQVAGFFADDIWLQAGQMFEISYSDL